MRANNINFRVSINDARQERPSIYLYDVIGGDLFGGITDKMFADALDELDGHKEIDIRINSPGGDVFQGHTMFNRLRNHPAKIRVFIDGIAASIASEIAMAGDEITIAGNGRIMIHNPFSGTIGTAKEHRKKADLLDSVGEDIISAYVSRSSGDRAELQRLMDEETYFTAKQAKAMNLVDNIGEELAMAACIDQRIASLLNFKKVPQELMKDWKPEATVSPLEELETRIRTKLLEGRTENAA